MHPRLVQGAAAALLLLGFVADFRPVVPFVGVVLVVALVGGPRLFDGEEERTARLNLVMEVALLALGSLLMLLGHAGVGWACAFLATLVAGMAAVAEIWLRQAGRYVRRPQ